VQKIPPSRATHMFFPYGATHIFIRCTRSKLTMSTGGEWGCRLGARLTTWPTVSDCPPLCRLHSYCLLHRVMALQTAAVLQRCIEPSRRREMNAISPLPAPSLFSRPLPAINSSSPRRHHHHHHRPHLHRRRRHRSQLHRRGMRRRTLTRRSSSPSCRRTRRRPPRNRERS
jgi:hypothetical protein